MVVSPIIWPWIWLLWRPDNLPFLCHSDVLTSTSPAPITKRLHPWMGAGLTESSCITEAIWNIHGEEDVSRLQKKKKKKNYCGENKGWKLVDEDQELHVDRSIGRRFQENCLSLLLNVLKSKRLWSGKNTCTHCRPSHGTARKSHRTPTVTRHKEDN